MNKGMFQRILPHLIAIVIFLIVAVIYCKPVLEGKVLNQHDVLGWKGIAQQSFEFKDKYGHFPLWTNSVFSGMPTYTISMEATKPIFTSYVHSLMTLWLPKPINFFFLSCICFYFLCCVLRIRPWIGIMAALAYSYATYNPVIIAVGHDTKMQAMAIAPAIIGSLFLILKRSYWWGAALLAVTFSYQVGSQHLQIAYYTGLVIGFIIIAFLIYSWKKREIKQSLVSLSVALGAAILGFLTFAVSMLPIREYAKLTMRGGHSELTATNDSTNKTKGGLDKDYAFSWSYGIKETLTFIVPAIYGGSNGGDEYSAPTAFTEKMAEVGVQEEQAVQMENSYSYWGPQHLGTSGAVYFGAIICFLFIFGMVYWKSWHKWWIIPATLFAVILAWGKNFAAFNYFLFDYLPLYNKFRAPTMALVIPQLTFPLTAAFALNQFLTDENKRESLWKGFKLSAWITAGLIALLVMLYVNFDYRGANDTRIKSSFVNALLSQSAGQHEPTPQMQQQAESFGQTMINALHKDRKALFGGDLLRSIVLIGLAMLLMVAYLKNKLKPGMVMAGILVLSSFDVLAVGRRYLNDASFVEPSDFESYFTPTQADQQILADPNKPFRVFDQTDQQNGPFQSSRTSYFHNSVGGYHPAKLTLYQDLIEHQLSKGNMEVFDMLNTKYFITPNPATGQAVAQLNPGAFGNAWLVKAVRFVTGPDEEMNQLDHTSLKDTAIVQQRFKNDVKFDPLFDSSATIKLVENLNDKITYSFSAKSNQFAVFSEIYYPLGWKAFIDGKEAPIVKTDYALRGLSVPAGNHTIEFRFLPESYVLGNTLTFYSSLIAVLLLLVAIVTEFMPRKTISKKTT